jgi:hypothetical protein
MGPEIMISLATPEKFMFQNRVIGISMGERPGELKNE